MSSVRVKVLEIHARTGGASHLRAAWHNNKARLRKPKKGLGARIGSRFRLWWLSKMDGGLAFGV